MAEHSSSWASKIAVGTLLMIVAGVAGYLIVYWWVYRDFNDALNVGALKNQVVATQKANDVKSQLKSLGYTFDETDFFQLNAPSTTSYRANVLEGYEPKKIEQEEVKEEGYYFYDESGMAYYFIVDENNQIVPDSMVPLITE